MLSETLRSIADWWQRHGQDDAPPLALAAADAAFMGGLLADLAEQASTLEHATILPHARLTALPDGVIDLAAIRAARGAHTPNGDHAA